MIDAHQHFWRPERGDYGWLDASEPVLYRDFEPEHLAPHIRRAGITGTVLVQAAATVGETRFLLELAERTDWIKAVVGWVPLEDPGVERTLDDLAREPSFRGVRPMIQDIPDDDWMLSEAIAPALRALVDRDLSLDALVHPRHLSRVVVLLERHPDLRVVVDHAAKPEIRAGRFEDWAADLARIARDTTACCKLSGLVTEAGPDWQVDDLRRYADHVVDCFGPERVMWGSDWPVVEIAGGFERWRAATDVLLQGLGDSERSAILGGAAARFYRIESHPINAATSSAAELDERSE